MTNLYQISSLRKIYPRSSQLTFSFGANIGRSGLSKPSSNQSSFKVKGKKGRKKSLISMLANEASERDRTYWETELGKIIREFGTKVLSPELKDLAGKLGIL